MSTNDGAKADNIARLYDFIYEKIKNQIIPFESDSLIKIINNIDAKHAEIIFLLMLHYHRLENKSTNTFQSTIYNGTKLYGGIGVKYSLSSIPPHLINIIIGYISYHKQILEMQDKGK